MMSIYSARETYIGRTDDAQSATFRALAWSQDEDSVPEPLPYSGEDYLADSSPAVPAARDRRSALLYGIAAGFAAAAVGGLLLTVMNTDSAPATTSVSVTQPVVSAALPQPAVATPTQVRQIRSSAPSQARVVAPAPEVQTAPAPEPVAPESLAPEPVAPAAPEYAPPVAPPPVFLPPVISLPEVTTQPVPHPVGPPTFHVPTLPPEGITLPPVITVPVAPPAPKPVITLKPGVTVPPMIPAL